jgi:hypothetical protein
MKIEITDDCMTLDNDGAIIATATRAGAGWAVTSWPLRILTRNEAITALTLAERLATGRGEDDPFVAAWREELARG